MKGAWMLPLLAAGAAAAPAAPTTYVAQIQMTMPYIPMVQNMLVSVSGTEQKISYYDGLEVDIMSAKGTWKYVFNNSKRVCSFKEATTGPTEVADDKWAPLPFFPDLSTYTKVDDELIGGTMCNKFELHVSHGGAGTMDDHFTYYYDPVLDKPVRWHMHARHVTFGSHTDEYIMDFLSVIPGTPPASATELPAECKEPNLADVAVQVGGVLTAARRAGELSLSARRVEDLNRLHAGKTTFKINKFASMSVDELLSFRGGRKKGSSKPRRTAEHWQYVSTHQTASQVSLPTDWDWRKQTPQIVGKVKDQAACGSCWAFGMIDPLESMIAKASGKPVVLLPEQFLVDCTWTNGTGDSSGNNGCDGGDSDIGAIEIVKKFNGNVPTAAAYGSYMAVNGYCKDIGAMEMGAKISGWIDVPKRQDAALMEALYLRGPMSISIQVPDEMLYYESGVLNVASCAHNESNIDHAVGLVGFGTEGGVDYWLVRNSWSTWWGDEGYIKIARGDNDCDVSTEAGFPQIVTQESLELVV